MKDDEKIYYYEGFKYILSRPLHKSTGIIIPKRVCVSFCTMETTGDLTIFPPFPWDGCSGPAYDDETNMRAGAIHDCGYKLIRLGLIPHSTRGQWDLNLQRDCRKDGMAKWRAWYYLQGVDHLANFATRKSEEPKELSAP